jgi:aspartate-semialdehyde dehydrogenase
MKVQRCIPKLYPKDVPLMFSALDSAPAKSIEAAAVDSGKYVVSNASAFRMNAQCPLIIPEVNPEHLALLNGKPGIITNPNCCAIPLALSLAPLQKKGIKAVCVSTYQAVSGAGYPGESAWDMIGNVHPYVGNEEEKLAIEPQKILGSVSKHAEFPISARCVRVPTADGHLLGVQVLLENQVTPEEAKRLFKEYAPLHALPSSPNPLFVLHTRRDRPSPRFDTMAGDGMAINIGRIEPCAVMTLKYFVLAHNTIRGAAGAAIANAELLLASNLLS